MRATPLLLLAAVVLGCSGVAAIEGKCSACEAVAAEVVNKLKNEKFKNPLDLRGRLDSKGNRYGKVIDYRKSEQYITDFFEDLCEIDNYAFMLNLENRNEWMQYKGEGFAGLPEWLKNKVPGGALLKQQKKELQGYCARLVEEHEEDFAGVLQDDDEDLTADGKARQVLCRTLTDECKKEDKQRARERKEKAASIGGSSTGTLPEPPRILNRDL